MKDPTHPSERSMPSPTQELHLSSAFLPFHFVWSNFPSILFKFGRALPPHHPPPLPIIHGYFKALLATVVFKVKIEFQEKAEGALKTAGSLGEGLDHFRLRFYPKSPDFGIKKYTEEQ